MKRNRHVALLVGASLPLCWTVAMESLPGVGLAAADASDVRASDMEEITVTARKRNEKLLDVPVAVVALSSQTIEKEAIYSLADLAQATPGVTIDGTIGGSARNDRSFPQYIIRGMTPATTSNSTTTVFIDGAPIISGQVEGLDDLERVEVLEGPQSAYFGRETFAGAINLVTKDPGDVFGGHASVLAGDPNYYDARVAVEGPIIGDFLTARATYRYYTKSGSYRNQATADVAPPGRLGDQSTQSGTLELVARPIENLKLKALYMQWEDRDGPSAQEVISASSQGNCTFANGVKWFCGTAPKAASGPAANTLVDAPLQAFLNKSNTAAAKQVTTAPHGYGLARDAYHWNFGADYDIPSVLTVSSLTSVDHQVFGELQDFTNADTSSIPNAAYGSAYSPYAQSYYNIPFLVEEKYENFSQELRLTSDPNKRFRWLVGVNYEWSKARSSLAGSGSYSYFVPTYTSQGGNDTGGFYGLAFDVTDKFTFNVEGRFERVEESASDSTTGKVYRGVYNNYIPRFIAQYKFTPDIMGYATFSEGVNPGAFNSGYLSLSAADQAKIVALGATVKVQPEKLKNYELGVKGRFLDNSLEISADIYHDLWSHQINVESYVYIEYGAPYLTQVDLNDGRSNIDGLEFKANWRPIQHLDVDGSLAFTKTTIKQGRCNDCSLLTGQTDSESINNGHELPNVSKYQAALGVQYGDALVFLPNWDYFVRIDDRYKSGSYASADNLVKSPNLNFVNMRVGITRDQLRLEAFVNNAFNESGYTNLAYGYNAANPSEGYYRKDALVAGLPDLRSFGLRASYKFGGVK